MKYLKSILRVFSLAYSKIKASPKLFALPLLAILMLIQKYLQSKGIGSIQRTSLSDFIKRLESGEVMTVLIKDNYLLFKDKLNQLFKVNYSLFPKNKLFDKLIEANVNFQSASKLNTLTIIKIFAFSAAITFLFMNFFFDKQGSMQTTSKPINNIRFQDIVGLNSSKVALNQVIQYMKNPKQFNQIGARMRKGIILYGPSGTGKTTLAKACAGEANVPFYSCNASQFCEMYVGMGPKKVRQLFKKAKQTSPSIIYIDQIDAMGNRKSSLGYMDGASTQKNSTINQLLSQMDGFASSDQVLVIGSTNRIQMLDTSLLRPGRFDLKIQIPLPDLTDRVSILQHHLKNKNNKLSKQYLTKIGQKLKGWSGADLQNLANQSVYTALRRKSQQILQSDIQQTLKILA